MLQHVGVSFAINQPMVLMETTACLAEDDKLAGDDRCNGKSMGGGQCGRSVMDQSGSRDGGDDGDDVGGRRGVLGVIARSG